eukprot:SAG31_NODE_577_length_13952_cov_2.717121_2_plen_1076_part_00
MEVFKDFKKKELEAVFDKLEIKDYNAGETVIRKGGAARSFYMIKQGTVGFDVEGNGKIKWTRGPTEYFGEIALIEGGQCNTTAIAQSDCQFYVLSKSEFDRLLKDQLAEALDPLHNGLASLLDSGGHPHMVSAEVQRMLKEYDTDGDGQFSVDEVEAIVSSLLHTKKEAKNMRYLLLAAFVAILALCASMFSMSVLGNEFAKDFRPNESGNLEDADGNVVGVAVVEETFPLSSDLPVEYFHSLKTLLVEEDEVSVNFQILGAGRIPAAWARNGGGFVMVMHTIAGRAIVDGTTMHFDDQMADALEGRGLELDDSDDHSVPASEGMGRRLQLSSADDQALVFENAEGAGRRMLSTSHQDICTAINRRRRKRKKKCKGKKQNGNKICKWHRRKGCRARDVNGGVVVESPPPPPDDGLCRNQDGEIVECCSADCVVDCDGGWSDWTRCSTTCGEGTQTRTYAIHTAASGWGTKKPDPEFRGQTCPHPAGFLETQSCVGPEGECSGVDCVGFWGSFGECSAPCDGGTRTREYSVTIPASNGGSTDTCDAAHGAIQSATCNVGPCPDHNGCETPYQDNCWSKTVLGMPFLHSSDPDFDIDLSGSADVTWNATIEWDVGVESSASIPLCLRQGGSGADYEIDCRVGQPSNHIRGLMDVSMAVQTGSDGPSGSMEVKAYDFTTVNIGAMIGNALSCLTSAAAEFLPSDVGDTLTEVFSVLEVLPINIDDLLLSVGYTTEDNSIAMAASGTISFETMSLDTVPDGPEKDVLTIIQDIASTASLRAFSEVVVNMTTPEKGQSGSGSTKVGLGTTPFCIEGSDEDCDDLDECHEDNSCSCMCKTRLDDGAGGGISAYTAFAYEPDSTSPASTEYGAQVGFKVRVTDRDSDNDFLHFIGSGSVTSGPPATLSTSMQMRGIWEHAFGIKKVHFGDAIVETSFLLPLTFPPVPTTLLLGGTVFMGEENLDACVSPITPPGEPLSVQWRITINQVVGCEGPFQDKTFIANQGCPWTTDDYVQLAELAFSSGGEILSSGSDTVIHMAPQSWTGNPGGMTKDQGLARLSHLNDGVVYQHDGMGHQIMCNLP